MASTKDCTCGLLRIWLAPGVPLKVAPQLMEGPTSLTLPRMRDVKAVVQCSEAWAQITYALGFQGSTVLES